ncbi:MAG: PDZ domain-containing protein [Ktedonobacteraceae bacterium]
MRAVQGDQAGLKEGDIIVQIDNIVVTDLSEFNNYVLSKNPGTQLMLHVYQGNQHQTVTVTLGTLKLP